MEKPSAYAFTTADRIKVIGAGILMMGVAAPATLSAETEPSPMIVEQAYIPEELDYLPDNRSVILK